jgi:hypothetical protein
MATKKLTALTIKLEDLYTVNAALSSIERLNQALPFVFAWLLEDLKSEFKIHVTRFETERNNLLTKWGTPVEGKPQEFTFKEENMQSYNDELKALGEIEVDVKFKPLTKEDFESVRNLQLATGVLSVIKEHLFVKEEVKSEEPILEEVTS